MMTIIIDRLHRLRRLVQGALKPAKARRRPRPLGLARARPTARPSILGRALAVQPVRSR